MLAKLGKQMDQFFAPPSARGAGSPARKSARAGAAESSEPSLSRDQMTWIGSATSKAFEAFGKDVGERVTDSEMRTTNYENENLQMKQEIVALQGEIRLLKDNAPDSMPDGGEFQTLKEEVAGLRTSLLSQPAPILSHGPASHDDWLGSIPPQQRVYARIDSLGFDTDGETLLVRAKEMLQKCDVKPDEYSCLAVVRDPGSLVSVTFNEASRLQEVRRKMQVLQHEYQGIRGAVWLDVEQSKAERKPARIIHRAAEMLTDVEGGRQDKHEVQKIMNGKQIKVVGTNGIGKLMAFSFRGTLEWSVYGQRRYDQNQRDMVTAFAEA
jgi:hypothetical protein